MSGTLKQSKYIILLPFFVAFYHKGCENSQDLTNIKSTIIRDDICLLEINRQMLAILSNPHALMNYLNIDSTDANIISSQQNRITTQHKDELITKLTAKITDTTSLLFECSNLFQSKIYFGDLALLSIYKIEAFPFGLALGRQWCTGNSISVQIRLPYNLIDYTAFKRTAIQQSYKEYYKSNERLEDREEEK